MGKATASAPVGAMKEPKRLAPYKAHGSGVRATGTVDKLEKHPEGGSHVRMTIRHAGPQKEGEYSPYGGGDETHIVMPAGDASRFGFGDQVTVHVAKASKARRAEPDADDAPAARGPVSIRRAK